VEESADSPSTVNEPAADEAIRTEQNPLFESAEHREPWEGEITSYEIP
jgi:hypothetical protein